MDRLISENEDCVRRANLISKLEILDRRYGSDFYWETRKIVDKLPSVKPQEKTGHWILLDECANSGYYCSNCQKKLVKEGWSNTVKKIKYCPNCGAKMESEDKE